MDDQEVMEASLELPKYEHRRPYPSEAAGEEVLSAECWVSFLFIFPPSFYIFSLVTASLISLDLKPPHETGKER